MFQASPASQPSWLIHHFTDEALQRAVSIAVTMMNEATSYNFLKQYIELIYCQHLQHPSPKVLLGSYHFTSLFI